MRVPDDPVTVISEYLFITIARRREKGKDARSCKSGNLLEAVYRDI